MSKLSIFAAATTLLVGLVAIWFSKSSSAGPPAIVPRVPGRNNTALFIVQSHHGFSNVHLATADALLERHPQIQIQFASFPTLENKVKRISSWGQTKNQASKPIEFHAMPGRDYELVLCEDAQICTVEDAVIPLGLEGLPKLEWILPLYLAPWPDKEHLEIYQHARGIIDRVNPAVVVLDTVFGPAIDATRESNRLHIFITPNTLFDNFAGNQPRLGFFWKYPVTGSGFSFPVPWADIPLNVYQAIRFVVAVFRMPTIKAKQDFLIKNGIKKPLDFFHLQQDDVPWITQTMPGASIPIEFVPNNVSSVGPIAVSVAPIAEQDAELSDWLKQKPTIFINLGSSVKYSEERVTVMVGALKEVLSQREDVQVLWKLIKEGVYSDDFSLPVKQYIDSGRLKLSSWLKADPTAILESGNVIAFVHHGGANCYHEALLAGVPHVILPLWVDLYSYATLVELTGLGVWGCPKTSPQWTPDCISEAILKVVDGGEPSQRIFRTAQRMGEKARNMPGRYGAADIVAKLAGSGY